MKKTILVLALLLSEFFCFGQKIDTVYVSFNKTVLMVFDSPVLFDDIGSPEVLIDRDANKIKLAAGKRNFTETNLHVETESGLYSFILVYRENPSKLLYRYSSGNVVLESTALVSDNSANSNNPSNGAGNYTASTNTASNQKNPTDKKKGKKVESPYERDCFLIDNKENTISGVGVISKKTMFFLGDMFVKGNQIYFKVLIRNTSNIPFDIELMRFVIRNRKGPVKGSAVQESPINPLYVYNEEKMSVEPKDKLGDRVTKIFVFDKFTIDSDKFLHFELWEAGGDRIMEFTISSKDILKVKAL